MTSRLSADYMDVLVILLTKNRNKWQYNVKGMQIIVKC